MTVVMHWFRRDLRVSDNPALNYAASSAQASGSALLCVYCHDIALDTHLPWGAERTSRFRKSFLRETLDSLNDSLKAKGSFLLELHGPSAATIAQCARDFKVNEISFQPEVAPEEIEQEMSLQQGVFESGIKLSPSGSGSLIDPAFGPFTALTLPDLFTHFRIEAEKKGKFPEPVSAPAYFPPPPKDTILFGKIGSNFLMSSQAYKVATSHPHLTQTSQFVGGEKSGLKRIHDYFWATDAVLTYFDTRNSLAGNNTSTRFSPWLSNGSISSRRILAELKNYERERAANKSTYWVFFELLWRDFFRAVSLKYGALLYTEGGLPQKQPQRQTPLARELENFKKWREGSTGQPLVDACMNELGRTGFLSNRGRQIVASFLIHNLHVRWTWGAWHFESMLVDYDPSSNWGNWAYQAGVGNDLRGQRIFNLDKQAQTYDPDGEYQKRWQQ